MVVKRHVRLATAMMLVAAFFLFAVECSAAPALNLLTPNQATLGWDAGGFFGATGGGTTPEVTWDSTRCWNDNASLRIKGDGSKRGQGIWMASIFVPDNKGTYTFSGYIQGTPGDSFYVLFEEKGAGGTGVQKSTETETFVITGSGWQRFSATITMSAGDSLGVTVRHNATTPFEVWLDGMQLEVGSAATAWNAPPTDKNMVLYNQAASAFDTRGFIGLSSVTMTLDQTRYWESGASLKIEGKGTGNGQGIRLWPAFVPEVGGVYTFSVYLYGQAGDEFALGVEEKASNGTTAVGTAVAGVPFKLKGDGWERHIITTKVENQRVALTVKHNITAPFTLWVDGIQLEKGSEATAFAAPTKP